MTPPDSNLLNQRVDRSLRLWLLQMPFAILAIAAPVATLSLPHLPRVLLGPNMFLSALPLANEIATIHFLQLVCVGLMVCAGIGLTRGMGGWLAALSRLMLWSCAISTSIHDPILSVATNSVFRHWQGLSTSPEVILDAAGNLPSDTLIRLAHPVGSISQFAWCAGIGLEAIAWKRTGSSWFLSLGFLLAMLFASPVELARYIGLIGFGVMAVVWERSRLQGNLASSEST
ncbi:MAG: hypothetical protein AAGE92_03750 [Cyanobacteria bacterium P01_G01_bin.4]